VGYAVDKAVPNKEATGTGAEAEDAAQSSQPLQARIRACYDNLPSSERSLADLLLEFPGDITLCSATELAQRAQVSNAAVSRLVRRLGYSGYREAQLEVRNGQESGHPLYLNNSLVRPAGRGDSLDDHITQDLNNLAASFAGVSREDLAAVVSAILKAERVWVLGLRNSYFFASYARRQLILARPDVFLLPTPGQTLMEEMASVGPRDLVLAIGLRRRVPALRKVMEILHSEGVQIAYVTDRRAVATVGYATWAFRCHTRGLSLFDSNVGVISLLNYLCTEVMAEAGEAGRKRLKRIEELLDRSGELDVQN